LIYDHHNRKFYLLQLGSSNRYIAVAEDLHEMYDVLSKNAKDNTEFQSPSDFKEFTLQALELLQTIGRGRFNMPWRWSPWSNNYNQVLQQWLDPPVSLREMVGTGILGETRSVAETRKK
jgi:hypothetical protein